MAEHEFEPLVVAFCCNYCAFAAADLAGSMRLNYPTNVRIVRIPCSGKIDGQYILDSFLNGADGVLVVGCMEGDCHFISGNFKAKKRVKRVKELLDEVGLEPERLEFHNNSAAMGPQLAEIFRNMVATVKELGPSPIKKKKPSADGVEVHP